MTTSNTEVDGLTRLAANPARHRVAIADILSAMGDNGVMMLILLFALPNAVPAPPGTSTVLGLPLLFLTLQWLRGKKPWVPGWIARQSLRRSDFAAIMKRLTRFSSWTESISHPRFPAFAGASALRLAGVMGVILSAVLVLPLPLVNVPSGIALVLFALGGLRRDGVLMLLGFVAALASVIVATVVVIGMWRIGGQLLALARF
ncbi:exopolysaccharide biosynthesis protein [Variovorax sp. PBL-E5]|uniref:exopolysaccharide biosynthesis protein n=1 Tax=Variovorax sp. PBL-E5 TaxID=434014 RepID=UPI001316B1A3|nr:exopolysaccharide biosynthesis protein [Variovorax sp. PBL-E5]VTU21937.1 Exopolysaccharide synthesis, ExoD [Variovorax sp. PBL-E5]